VGLGLTRIDEDAPIAGCYPVTGALAQRGYRLNKFCRGFLDPHERARFKADEAAYLAAADLCDDERAMIRARDWLAMVRYGASPYLIFRLSGAVGVGLAATGAQMRGETLEQFIAGRKVRGAK
jgi:protocatechuate 4,5-dioxygenase alpha subunit